jgi:phosphoribosylaminoimidazolecarboxamide formyltransferase / IMP cyclohydrolase
MEKKSLASMYREINTDDFPSRMEISFYDEGGAKQSIVYEKMTWEIEGKRLGLRYGENPDQSAALYRPINGNLSIGGVSTIAPGRYLASDVDLLQSGKHPGKINITDVDNALNILRYLGASPACAIMKHHNPSGVAKAASLEEAYLKAYKADRLAAYGGAIGLNRVLDKATCEAILGSYCEVIAAPDFEEGVLEMIAKKKNIRVMRVKSMDRLETFVGARTLDFKNLIDGSAIVQWSFVPRVFSKEDFLPAETTAKDGSVHAVKRQPTEDEYADMIFGWHVETAVTSNSVIYVKDGVTVGIGTGEQDRVGVAEFARDKAYLKRQDWLCFERYSKPWNIFDDEAKKAQIVEEVRAEKGGLIGSTMVSDAFFPFRDGIDVGLREGVRAVVQPGGSINDPEVIDACNEYGATMAFTGQRCFKH